MMLRKPNFQKMSLKELRNYVLNHRDDDEAWQEFTSRERPNAIHFDTDMPLSQQKIKLKQLLQENQ